MTKTFKAGLVTSIALGAIAFATPSVARQGADDPAGHIRQCRGCDDPAGHVRQARGADDSAAMRRADDKATDMRQNRGNDDPPGDDRGRGRGRGGDDRAPRG